MKYRAFVYALAAIMFIGGCGLVSGTVFISQDVEGGIESSVGSILDDTFAGRVVDFRENDDWDKVDIDGVEDVCIRMTAENLLAQNVSGEVWITPGETVYATPAQVRANGFRIFSGIALTPNQTRVFTCAETLELFENLDKLADAVKDGVFGAWAMGDQNVYHIRYTGVVFGMHVTGSI